MTKTYDQACMEHGVPGSSTHADGTKMGEGLFYCYAGGGHVFSGRELERCDVCRDTTGMVQFADSAKPSLWHECDHDGGCTCHDAPAISGPVSVAEGTKIAKEILAEVEAETDLPKGITFGDGLLQGGHPEVSTTGDTIYFQRTDSVVRFLFMDKGKRVFSLLVLNSAKMIEVPPRPGEEPTDG